MKIVYGLQTKDVQRMDAIVLTENELPDAKGVIAFRGDDRKPSEIFQKGFTARDSNYRLEGTQIVDGPTSWNDIFNEHALKHTDVFSLRNVSRTAAHLVQDDELSFRPNHLDLQKETCVSLTLDASLAVGFPLTASVKITYLYAVKLTGKYLPTYNIQDDGGNFTLAQSKEVTALSVPGVDVIGAGVVHRTVEGSASLSIVDYRITAWEDNPILGKLARGTYINETISMRTNHQVALSGTKKVSPGMKASTNTASNPVLKKALLAIQKHTLVVLSGTPPDLKTEAMSKSTRALLDF